MSNQAYQLPFRSIGLDVTIWPLAKVIDPERISIGDSVIIDDFVFLAGGEKTDIGSFVHIGAFTCITGNGAFTMEDFSGLSGGVSVYTGNEDYLGESLTNPAVPAPYRTPIRSFVHIKKHAIVGAKTVILPGVTIGEGAAIGANSLITKDCAPWTVYAGSPARPIRARPSERIFELEAQLRRSLYDVKGHYIPKDARDRSENTH
jgi:acetyltransferase-like isoleucine patch superfamily enzyme